MKKLIHTQSSRGRHWVGDGFPVRSIFTYNDLASQISPFLLMDYAGPAEFTPTDKRRGVGEHPHRGFETVTIVYSGVVEHRDSAGGGGIIRAGDVQWMTAASGLVHEEFHGQEFAETGGVFEIIQLWVNLPKKHKMAKPRYQGIPSPQIPVVTLPDDSGTLRVIAGQFAQTKGAALTFSEINLWDMRINKGAEILLTVPEGHTAAIFVRRGEITNTEDGKSIGEAEIGVLENEGRELKIQADDDSQLLFLGGEPLNEPIIGYGPFVMNTSAEIHQAFLDYQSGKMGALQKIESN